MANHLALTKQQELRAVVMYIEQRMSVASISRELGVHYETTKAALRRCGVQLRPRGRGQLRKASRDVVQEVLKLYQHGIGCEELAEMYDVAPTTITRWVKESGGEVRPAGFQRGEAHHDWKGGIIPTPDGYLLELVREDDPFFEMGQRKVGSSRYAFQHRLVMARHLGRPLEPYETVHHIDGDIQNNVIENLQLRNGKHGSGVALCCADCGSHNIIEQELH